MARSASQLGSLLRCPHCGRHLYPNGLDSILTFYCKSGHKLSLSELLGTQVATVREGLEAMLAEWVGHHLVLIETAEDARKNGYSDVAHIYQRHAHSLGTRIDKVPSVIAESDSSKRIILPEAIRSVQPLDNG